MQCDDLNKNYCKVIIILIKINNLVIILIKVNPPRRFIIVEKIPSTHPVTCKSMFVEVIPKQCLKV